MLSSAPLGKGHGHILYREVLCAYLICAALGFRCRSCNGYVNRHNDISGYEVRSNEKHAWHVLIKMLWKSQGSEARGLAHLIKAFPDIVGETAICSAVCSLASDGRNVTPLCLRPVPPWSLVIDRVQVEACAYACCAALQARLL